uniref:NADH dehydrogenase subunit 5 n=1 Tax=Aonchotheca putorii TaxID=1647945 RepID=UPI00237A0EBE|nr:NADH dehydrogenase subunit 5 [Aonchotheca putorii]WBV76979.1 NADH dehydrogenase subunit 5 [Aonchotheca putorii]
MMAILSLMMLIMLLFNGIITLMNMNILTSTWDMSFEFNNPYIKMFSITVIVLSMFISFYCLQYMDSDISINRFCWILISFISSMLILNMSNSNWILWLGWEGLGVTSFLLIIYYTNWKSNNSSMTTLMMNRVGDFSLLLMMSSFCCYLLWDINNYKLSPFFCMILMMAIFAKSAQIPFQSWLPIAMAAPTPVSSLVHSSTLVVAGVMICIKMNNYFFNTSMTIMTIIGFLTSLYASFMAIVEKDFKKILAYSTMSQIALVMFMVSSNLTKLMVFHIINHAFAKALLFMNVGLYILYLFGNQESRSLEMKTMNSSIISFMLIMSMMIMCGSFFTSCYYSKEYQLIFTYNQESLSYMTNIMIFMSFAYSIRMIVYILMNVNTKIIQNFMIKGNITNIMLLFLSLMSGWLLSWNFSIPFNLEWSTKKMTMMFLPILIIIMSIHTLKNMMNLDIEYNYPIKNTMKTNYAIYKKIKFMSISKNIMLKQYMFMSEMKFIMIPIGILMLLVII